MTSLTTRTAADRPAARSLTRLDALAMAALLIVAVLPVARELSRPGEPLEIGTRVQLGAEAQSRRALLRGELPVWNPYQFGGRPHLADLQTRAVYPPHVVLRVLPLPLPLLLPVSFVLHAWVAGFGAYLVARQLGAVRIAAFMGSVAVILLAIVNPDGDVFYSPTLYAMAWVPPVLALTLRSLERPRPLIVLGLGAAVIMGLTASPRGWMYVLPGVVALYVFSALWRDEPLLERRRALVRLAVILAMAVGICAYQVVPAMRVSASMAGTGGLRSDDVFAGSWHESTARHFDVPSPLAKALRSLRGGRVLAACESAVDASRLLALGVPAVGGAGGVYAADYARFLSIALGGYPEKPAEYSGVTAAGHHPARPDLLQLLNASYLVSCAGADPSRWQLLEDVDGVGIYQSVQTLPRAFWTCAPTAVGRGELEYRLRWNRYDETLTLQRRGPAVNVRWAAGVNDAARAKMEAAYRIAPERSLGDRTWQYELLDASAANVGAIVSSPDVEDTSGIDRGTLELVPAPPPVFGAQPRDEWLLGVERCERIRPANVLRDEADGRMTLAVDAPRDGILFVSETFYTGRSAWVDGRRVNPLNVNLAFVGVPVTAGIHRVELRHDTRALSAGFAVSGVTVLGSMLWAWRARSRP